MVLKYGICSSQDLKLGSMLLVAQLFEALR
jgi:hypothetical protein